MALDRTKQWLNDPGNFTGHSQVLEEYEGADTANLALKTTFTIGDDILSQGTVGGSVNHLLYDGHGSTRTLTDAVGSVTDTFHYDAYGVDLAPNRSDDKNFGPVNTASTNLRYSGEWVDDHMQQQYLRARWYDPGDAQWNRLDDYSGKKTDPQSLHKYAYCHGDAVNGIDPSGQFLGNFISLLNTISIMAYLRISEAVTKNAAKIYIVTKIAFYTFLASTGYLLLMEQGLVPYTPYMKWVQLISGAVFIVGFIALGFFHDPNMQPRHQVRHGSTRLSKAVNQARKAEGISSGRNGAAFQYVDDKGQRHIIVRFSERGQGHSERIIARELESMGVKPHQVEAVYSELHPCGVPGGYCDRFLRRFFPNAQVSYSFEYGDSVESRRRGVEQLKEAVQSLFE